MKSRILILGGGFLGQLCHVFLPRARVLDWRPSAPTVENRALGPMYLWKSIPELRCSSFEVITTIDGTVATDDTIRRYKRKVGKEQDGSDWRAQFQLHTTGWECQLPLPRVEYGKRVLDIRPERRQLILQDGSIERYDTLISTIPMPAMLKLIGRWQYLKDFVSRPIYIRQWHDAIAPAPNLRVNYVSDESDLVYRQTHRDRFLFEESLSPIGIDVHNHARKLLPGKIYPSSSRDYCRDILAEMDILGIGRYASWNPEELAHESIDDLRTHLQRGLA